MCYFCNLIKPTFFPWGEHKKQGSVGTKSKALISLLMLPAWTNPLGAVRLILHTTRRIDTQSLPLWKGTTRCMQPSFGVGRGNEIALIGILWPFSPHLLPFSKWRHPMSFYSASVLQSFLSVWFSLFTSLNRRHLRNTWVVFLCLFYGNSFYLLYKMIMRNEWGNAGKLLVAMLLVTDRVIR